MRQLPVVEAVVESEAVTPSKRRGRFGKVCCWRVGPCAGAESAQRGLRLGMAPESGNPVSARERGFLAIRFRPASVDHQKLAFDRQRQ